MKNNQLIKHSIIEDSSSWYTNVLNQGKFVNYGLVKGTIALTPYSCKIWENIQNHFNNQFRKLNIDNVYLPSLIPLSELQIEKDHLDGFLPEVAIVTQVGEKKIAPLVIRPTSEVLFCHYFKNNLVSYRDLPIQLNQWCNVVRWEKNTRPFLRNSEFLWQEGHTIHETSLEAQTMVDNALNTYKDFVNNTLDIYCLSGKKTEREKFAGADETNTIELIMKDGQCLQSATSHNLGQNFTKMFDIAYQKNNKKELPFQTSFGISTRIIGGLILSHGDDQGAIMPPDIAPYQVVICTILANKEQAVSIEAKKLYVSLNKKYRVLLDDSDKSIGFKINDYEVQGIPIRIEIGPKNIVNDEVVIVTRINGHKETINFTQIDEKIAEILKTTKQELFLRSKTNLEKKIKKINSKTEFIDWIINHKGVALVPFCLDEHHEKKIKDEHGITARCISTDHHINDEVCFETNKPAKAWVYFGRAY
ncbi:hypothetical protein ASO20_02145 [Mycoplasma sp. (ex Biomphalaria glabrata)]|uniref:proline--tRNA ligase n=1 Tax=Mycoplasma sp. (ex Biomphalaria glabrata) TaxID=1749074 RepID=UPI00073AA1E7|nr:proline--tRNA ligase [Mycoplasma sp. (ex Biomphalaria glabrata)]ALV23442.1 hypothetical protein ASO20_02145 [Mycoplasma sp. (ex Biomphalaria glabrata)]